MTGWERVINVKKKKEEEKWVCVHFYGKRTIFWGRKKEVKKTINNRTMQPCGTEMGMSN